MTQPFIYIEVDGGIITDIRHNLPTKLDIIIKTSDDDSLLDNSFGTTHCMPSPSAELTADIAYTVRVLAAAYNLPGWTNHSNDEIVNKLLTTEYDLDPTRLTYNISAAIPALKTGYPVLIDGMPVADIEREPDGIYNIYCLPDPDFHGAGIIKQSPGDFHPDDEVFTVIRTVCSPTNNDGDGEDHDENAGDDLCDHCMRSGIQISHTRDGKTICDDCLAAMPTTRRIEIARLWENHYWDTAIYTFDLEPGQDEPSKEDVLKAVNADAFDIIDALIFNLDPDDPEGEEHDDTNEDWEPVKPETVTVTITGLQARNLLGGQTVEDLDLRYQGHRVDHLLVSDEETTIFWYITIGNDDTQHHASVASYEPVFTITIPKT